MRVLLGWPNGAGAVVGGFAKGLVVCGAEGWPKGFAGAAVGWVGAVVVLDVGGWLNGDALANGLDWEGAAGCPNGLGGVDVDG